MGKRGRPGEVVGMFGKVRNLTPFTPSPSCFREKVNKRNKVPGERKRRTYKRQIQTRKERK